MPSLIRRVPQMADSDNIQLIIALLYRVDDKNFNIQGHTKQDTKLVHNTFTLWKGKHKLYSVPLDVAVFIAHPV